MIALYNNGKPAYLSFHHNDQSFIWQPGSKTVRRECLLWYEESLSNSSNILTDMYGHVPPAKTGPELEPLEAALHHHHREQISIGKIFPAWRVLLAS
jgi:hypothetical protein